MNNIIYHIFCLHGLNTTMKKLG